MDYRGAGLSRNMGDEPWDYYNQVIIMLLFLGGLSFQAS